MDPSNSQQPDPNQGGGQHESYRPERAVQRSNWPMYLLATALVVAIATGYVYTSRQRQQTRDLAAANHSLTTSLIQVQDQLQSVNQRLTDLLARTPPPRVSSRVQGAARARRAGESGVIRDDPRFGKIQNQLDEHQKQLANERDDLDKTRTDLSQTRDDLQSNLNSTKDELNGSIARTHDDVVALQKRGESNYYEFTVDKTKQ